MAIAAARNTFTLSQAVLIRGASNFNAFGTMLLSQDVGQSLFLSAKLEGLGAPAGVSGDLRLIARRVFLDKLPLIQADGRGTLDATLHLQDGLVHSASWQASAREIEFDDDARVRFDHFTVDGKLERDADDFLLRFADLQITRGSRLERSPGITARISVEPGTTRIARTTLSAERVPFMAAEFITQLLAPQLADRVIELPGGWVPTSGELRAVRFDSGQKTGEWDFSAQITGGDFERRHDHARISQLAAKLQLNAGDLALEFDPANAVNIRVPGAREPRALNLEGRLAVVNGGDPSVRFEGFSARSAGATLAAEGAWNEDQPLALTVSNVDRALLLDGWTLLADDAAVPERLSDIEQGVVVEGTLNLQTVRDDSGSLAVNWQRSSGKLQLAGLASSGDDLPRLSAGRGTLEFSRGHTKLLLDGGDVEQLAVSSARLDWPRTGAPSMHAALEGDLASPALRQALKGQGLDRLTGAVTLEADARGEKELREPDLWRVSARLRDVALPLGGDLPPVEKLAGTLRYSGGQLRGLALEGTWLGGPIEIESRRTMTRGPGFSISGVADTARLLRLLGESDAAGRLSGQVSWTGTAQRLGDGEASDAWQLSLASTLTGVESRLPEPFSKPAARALPVSAQLRVNVDGIQDFQLESGRDLKIHGAFENGIIAARFEVQGVTGDLRRAGNASPKVRIEQLDMRRSPSVLAAAASMLPADDELALEIDDLRHANQSLGAVQATLARRNGAVEFSLESAKRAAPDHRAGPMHHR